ncbi:MAG: DUF1634 domain-containing protein [Desmonostoc vinosum HA7617-LM4]|jgi:uncharacterized membrane protein|nr:DUF1634 domain-containing protein [Desmonostoc vinosum HA7617-LM4]
MNQNLDEKNALIATLPLQSVNVGSNIDTLTQPCLETSDTKNKKSQLLQNPHLLDILLSYLLKYSVLLVSAVVLLGGILYLLRHGAEPTQYQFFHGEPPEFRSFGGVITTALSGNDLGIIQLGLLLLIATPILRVVVSLVVFVKQQNWIYVTITALVLTALIYSLLGAYL